MNASTDFQVVVIGGGPAGCYAALTAAKQGLRVALFEEHAAIGWPRHDPGWLMESRFAKSVVASLGKSIAWIPVKEYRVYKAESGELLESSKHGGYLLRRDLLEKEIARMAVAAGAKLFLRTGVTGMVRKDGRVEAVQTNSEDNPLVKAEVIICADGIGSVASGFAVKEELCQKAQSAAGVNLMLANAEVTPGVIEHHLSPESILNNRCFFTHQDGAVYMGFPSLAGFQQLRQRDDNVVSRKLRNAQPLEMNGYNRARAGKYGSYFEKMVRDNVMFIGDASGGAGNIHGMMQGKFAGTVAAAAIREHDTSEKRLTEYQEMVGNTLVKVPFCWMSARDDFGTFDRWFREFAEVTKGVEAGEVSSSG